MKFDLIISNPPYKGNLHLKILDSVLDLGKEIIFVQPSSHYIQKKGTNKMFNYIINKTSNILKKLIFFNGNPVFNIGLFVPCVITHIDKNSSNNENFILKNLITKIETIVNKDKVNEIYFFGYDERINSIKNKISSDYFLKDIITVLGFHGDQTNNRVLKNPNSYFVEFTHIRGNTSMTPDTMFKDDFFTIMSANKKPESGRNPKYNLWAEFSTELEAKNFINYCKTDFARFCLFLNKFSQAIAQNELALIPVVDFTRSWTNEELYEHFNISKEEQEFIKEVIKPYYD